MSELKIVRIGKCQNGYCQIWKVSEFNAFPILTLFLSLNFHRDSGDRQRTKNKERKKRDGKRKKERKKEGKKERKKEGKKERKKEGKKGKKEIYRSSHRKRKECLTYVDHGEFLKEAEKKRIVKRRKRKDTANFNPSNNFNKFCKSVLGSRHTFSRGNHF